MEAVDAENPEHPPDRDIALRQRDLHVEKDARIMLVAAVAPRLEDAEEA